MLACSHRRTFLRRPGLTLLEVILAIAIFGGALVAIGELIRIGSMSAAAARDLTEAQRYCNNVMAEVSAGIIPPESTSGAEVEGSEGWLYSIESAPLDEQAGLLSVAVTVEQDPGLYNKPLSFTLVRWMIDPAGTEAAAAEMEETASPTTTPSSTGGSSASGSTSGASGGATTGGQSAR